MRTRKSSFSESLANVVVGYVLSILAQVIVFPLLGIYVPFKGSLTIGVVLTVVSIIRSYSISRWYNRK